MHTHHANLPPFKSELKKAFGFLSFQCGLINMEYVGIRLLKSYEVVIILFRGHEKVGWVYEGLKFSPQQVLQIYEDVPGNFNELEAYEKKLADKIEILVPEKENYVFISDREISRTKRQNL